METDYIAEAEEALEMLGKGYNDEPSLVIEPERTVIERRQGELKEAVIPAFVKISTSFKAELEKMDGKSLKVWLYIALSINRNTGRAHPGLRTIARDTGMGVNTVQDCLKELEEMKLLHVDRKSRKFNIYEPTIYVSANRVDPVSGSDTDGKSVSEKPESVSEKRESVSASQILNQRNQNKPERDTTDPVFVELANLTGGLNSNTPKFVDTWREKHTDEWILKAIETAKERKARSVKYIDEVLISWEANGYPKTREQRIDERKQKPAVPRGMAVAQAWLAKKEAASGQ